MMKKSIICVVLVTVLLAGLFINSFVGEYEDTSLSINDNNSEKIFHGPVPDGYDLEHFRRTGETIKKAPANE